MAVLAARVEKLRGGDAGKFAATAPQLDLILASGGKDEIWPDVDTRRTLWGTCVGPASHEIWFSATSAQSITRPAYEEVGYALARLLRKPNVLPLSLENFFEHLRTRIARNFGAEGASVLLASSAAEARESARAIARILLRRPIIEIATTPAECAHFVPCDSADLTTIIIELRTPAGDPRQQVDMDTDALQLAQAALECGNAAFLHLLDTSKTGLCGVSRGAARALDRAAHGRTLALVDASEGRVYANEIRRDLAHGMMVLVSGSQFVGGPPFSAALLLPPGIADYLANLAPVSAIDLPIARFDAPRPLRRLVPNAAPIANPGLGLRWMAALHEQEDYLRIDETLRRDILETFSRKARSFAARLGFLSVEVPLLDHADDPLRESIVTLLPLTPSGSRRAMAYGAALQKALARPCPTLEGDAICHIGHPIAVGDRAALSISASAPMVREVVRRMDMGLTFDRAMTPVLRDLNTLFRKWEALAG